MIAKLHAQIVLGLLGVFGLASEADAQCSFGTLCGKTVDMLFYSLKTCVNGSCTEPGNFYGGGRNFFSSDGSVSAWVNGSSNAVPGLNSIFVCRPGSTKTANHSCKGSECKPDDPTPLDEMDFSDACSVSNNAGSAVITLTHKAHVYSDQTKYKDFTTDYTLTDVITITSVQGNDAAHQCDANIHASINAVSKNGQASYSQVKELYGAVTTPQFHGECRLYDGEQFPTLLPPAKVIDPGP